MTDSHLDRLTSPVVSAWLRGELTLSELQLARLDGTIDEATYFSLSRCTQPWTAHQHDRVLLLGNRIVTAPMLDELLREHLITGAAYHDMMPSAMAIQKASTLPTDLRRIGARREQH